LFPVPSRLVGQRGGDISQFSWFEANVIVDCIPEPLFAAKVSLSRLDAHVTKQELDLLQLSAGLMTQPRTSSPQIMRRNPVEAASRTPRFHNAPDHFRTEPSCSDPTGLVDRPEYGAAYNIRLRQPDVHRRLDPGRDRDRSDEAAFAY